MIHVEAGRKFSGPRGLYVRRGYENGASDLYPVSGSRQTEAAIAALAGLGTRFYPITHWDGTNWTDTGTVLDVHQRKA